MWICKKKLIDFRLKFQTQVFFEFIWTHRQNGIKKTYLNHQVSQENKGIIKVDNHIKFENIHYGVFFE